MLNKRKNEKGFAKIDRKILEWGWYSEPNTCGVMIHLIITANHAPHAFKGIIIERGQTVTGYHALANTLGLSVSKIRTAFKNLKNTGEIAIKVTSRFSVVTLCNYELYNNGKQQVGKQADKHVASISQALDNTKEEEEEKEEVISVFEYWNRLLIKQHRNISKFRGCINGALEHYSKGEIISAMENYQKIVNGNEYWFTHKWTLSDFLTRKNGIDCFMAINNPFDTYRKKDRGFVQSDRDENGYHKRVVL